METLLFATNLLPKLSTAASGFLGGSIVGEQPSFKFDVVGAGR